jgi:hypothetical protein
VLRESAQHSGSEFDLDGLTGGSMGETGIVHGGLLVAYAEAVVGDDEVKLGAARAALLEAMGPEALVDAAATVASFNSVVRVASATGIPLDEVDEGDRDNQEWFERLGINKFKKDT